MKQQPNITEGPITRTVFSLAIPVVVGMLMEFALSSTDYFWVGKLGPSAQDAITSSMVVIWTIFGTMAIITVGVTALVSRYVGAGDLSKVTHYIRHGLLMAVGAALIFTAIGYAFSPALLRFMDTGESTLAHAIPYLRIFFLSAIFFFLSETSYATFRASGDTRTPTKVGICVVLTNMVLDPLLIFGWGPIPALGVAGASLASGMAMAGGTAYIVFQLFRGRLGYRVGSLFGESIQFQSMLKITRIGLPSASQTSVFVFVYWFLIKIVHTFGETAGAAMGVGNRMESLSYLTCYGFSVAASTMVGQNLGAGKPDRAARCAWGAALSAIALTSGISVVFIVVPGLIASVFTADKIVHAMAVDYLIILGISQVAMAVEIVMEGAFGGAGDTVPPMLISVPGSLVRIPLAYYLCFNLDWGLNGVWWTLTITSFVKAAIIAVWFKRGRWKLKEV